MHYKDAKGILSPTNGMNLYRGCTHGCIYCDSRSKCYAMDHDFEDVEVKRNAPALLEAALKSKRRRCMIATGSMCDPYLPLEESENLTRRCLELVNRYGFGATVITKSDRVLRDLDLYRSINEKTKSVVQMTLTTYDEELCRVLEPNVCTTRRRFEALMALREAGIPTVVWLSPILPFLNDTEENLRGILRYCVEAGVRGILCFGMSVTLREGDREYFYSKLDAHFPGLKERYVLTFGNSYVCPSPDNDRLMAIFRDECRACGVLCETDEVFRYLGEFEDRQTGEQLSLF
jgi:DNA repair photolyase